MPSKSAPTCRCAIAVSSSPPSPVRKQSAFGEDAYPTLHLKAAALLQPLAQNQPFEDGNKRVAVLATFVFLGLNGLAVNAEDDAVVALMIDIAVVPLTLEQIAARLETWTTPQPPTAEP
jgi:death-on-curing protein